MSTVARSIEPADLLYGRLLASAAAGGDEGAFRLADGRSRRLPLRRWLAPVDAADRALLRHAVAPVLDMDEAPTHPHNVARGAFGEAGGVVQPMPAPRYGEPFDPPTGPRREGEDGPAILADLGYSATDIEELLT